ncbi:copper resistance protein CopC [Streptomyces sp. ZYX-F-203]
MTQRTGPWARTLTLLFLAAACALLGAAGPAVAHAALTGSDPRQGSVIDKAPDQVTLTFSESVATVSDADSLRVLDPRGERVDDGAATGDDGRDHTVRLHAGLPDGTYTVAYQVVSADGHPVTGAFVFSVGAPSATSVSVSDETAGGGLVGALYSVGRYVSYAGFLVLVGGTAFVLVCLPGGTRARAAQRLVGAGWLALTGATLTLLLLRGSYTRSGAVADIFDLGLLGQVLETRTGTALVSRLVLLAAAALLVSVLFAPRGSREEAGAERPPFVLLAGGAVVAVGLASSWALSEHASTGLQPGIAMPVDVLHLLAAAAWLGGLAALLATLRQGPGGPGEVIAVRRFSRVAFASLVTLVVTGAYQSWRQLGSWSAWVDTRYGQLLAVKIASVALLVGFAFLSRRWTTRLSHSDAPGLGADSGTPRGARASTPEGTAEAEAPAPGARPSPATTIDPPASAPSGDPARTAQLARQQAAIAAAHRKRSRDADPIRRGLRRSVLAEAGIAVVLLAVTAALTQTEPARTVGGTAAAPVDDSTGALTLDIPFDTGGENGQGVVRVDLDPARVGANDVHVYATTTGGRPLDLPEVRIALTLAAEDLGPLPVVPDHVSTGHWSASAVRIPAAGDWRVAVTVRTSDIDQVTVSKNAQIG